MVPKRLDSAAITSAASRVGNGTSSPPMATRRAIKMAGRASFWAGRRSKPRCNAGFVAEAAWHGSRIKPGDGVSTRVLERK